MNNNKWHYEFHPLGENGVVIKFSNEINKQTFHLVQSLSRRLESISFPWLLEYVPAFTTVTVYYHSLYFLKNGNQPPFEKVCQELKWLLDFNGVELKVEERAVEIPVCYGGEFGPDLIEVSKYHHLSLDEVISIHSNGEYFVYMIGFAPGFPYVGGLPNQIATPRRSSPRMNVPEGSVGIAANQTGIYPMQTPGGWQIIGRTPIALFRPNEEIPSFLRAGDTIRFVPISKEEYFLIKEGCQS
ncbi:MAG: 5-oxoprolinase subunit PxpB [Bacillota bacterium]|nr:5-oxoprolinase subunit PxpB [Bacillota bacterium]